MLQLVLDKNGNYVYKDVAQKKAPSIDSTAFEAYESKQKTNIAGETDIGSQTKQLMRETPGQYTTTFNEQTGQFETKQKDTGVSADIEVKPIEETQTTAPMTALEQVSKIAGMTRPSNIDTSEVAELLRNQQKLNERSQTINSLIKTADLGIKAYNTITGSGTVVSGTTGNITPLTSVSRIPVGQSTLGSVAGAGAVAYTLADTFKVKEKTGVTAGATIGMAVGGPVGAVAGSVIGGAIESVFGGSVICTELYKQNLMSREDHRLSWDFTVNNFSQTHIHGYWYWAVPMAKVMKKNKLVTKFWNHVMSNRTRDIKWRLKKGKFNLLGRLYSILIENGSYVIGKLIKTKEVLA